MYLAETVIQFLWPVFYACFLEAWEEIGVLGFLEIWT